MRVEPGTRVWIYSKLPVGRIEATAYLDGIYEAEPAHLWAKFHDCVGITRETFDEYFAGCDRGFALALTQVNRLAHAPLLASLKAEIEHFHAPQFFRRLSYTEVKALETKIR